MMITVRKSLVFIGVIKEEDALYVHFTLKDIKTKDSDVFSKHYVLAATNKHPVYRVVIHCF